MKRKEHSMIDKNNNDNNNKNINASDISDFLLAIELERYADCTHEFSGNYDRKKNDFFENIDEINNNIDEIKTNINEQNSNKQDSNSSDIEYETKDKSSYGNSINNIFKRRYLKVIAAAVLLVIVIPCTAVTAGKLADYYNVYINKIDKYSYSIGIQDNDVDGKDDKNAVNETIDNIDKKNKTDKFHTYVRIDINSDINNYSQETDGSNYKLTYIGKDRESERNISIMLIGLNTNEELKLRYVTDVKKYEEDDRNILWFIHEYGETVSDTSENGYINDIFIVYKDYGYAIEIKAQKQVPNEYLKKLVAGISLAECDEHNAAKANYRIYRDEYGIEGNESADSAYAGEYNDTDYKINDRFYMPDIDMYSSNKLQYTVSNYSVAESVNDMNGTISSVNDNIWNIDTLDNAGWITADAMKKVINDDGTFIKYKRPEIYNMGDGITTLNSVSAVKDTETRLVIADIQIENTSNDYVDNVRLIPQITCLYTENGKLMIPKEHYSNSLVNSEGYPLCVKFDSSLGIERNAEDINRTCVEPGEKIHILTGYLVDADRLDNMLLFYNSYGSLTYDKGKMAYIRLK